MSKLITWLVEHREYAGWMAGVLTTVSFLPQVLKTLREGHTKDLSLAMYAMFCAGVALWTVYGLLLESPPMIIANTITLLLAGAVLVMKIRNG
jgi:MtN3 and saliva related transmembrane protein